MPCAKFMYRCKSCELNKLTSTLYSLSVATMFFWDCLQVLMRAAGLFIYLFGFSDASMPFTVNSYLNPCYCKKKKSSSHQGLTVRLSSWIISEFSWTKHGHDKYRQSVNFQQSVVSHLGVLTMLEESYNSVSVRLLKFTVLCVSYRRIFWAGHHRQIKQSVESRERSRNQRRKQCPQ